LPTGFALNKPRLQLTGLEDPEELLERLNEARAQQQTLAQANKKLQSRVRILQRQLAEAGGLTDDELVAELPKRMGKALESAQDVASEIVRRARNSELVIRQKAAESAAQIVRQAEEQAAKVIEHARKEAASHRTKAEAEAQALIAAAQQEASRVQQRVAALRRDEARVVHAYDVVERVLAEARRTLRHAEAGAVPDQAGAGTVGASPARRDRARPVAVRPVLYDWSPPVTNAG
jgi:cell division septum initiation protein DivIVA